MTVTRREWAWTLTASVGVLALAALPDVAGYLSQTSDLRYVGVAVALEDNLSYLAKMGQGERGQWLFHLPYGAAPSAGAPVYTYYLWLGHIARWLGWPGVAVHHTARLAAGLGLLLMAYAWITRLTDDGAERRWLFALVASSSGFGWLVLAFTGGARSVDLRMPEANTFYSLLTASHFALAQTLLLAFALGCLGSAARRWTVLAGLALAALAILQPFAVATALGTAALCIVLLRWRDGRWPRALIGRTALGAAAALLLVAAIYWALQRDPQLRAWMSQSVVLSPPAWEYLTGYGLLIVPALYGARLAWQRRTDADLWLLAWLMATLIGVYAPTTLQRRLALGLHLPIACLAGLGLYRYVRAPWPSARQWLFARLFIIAAAISNLLLVALLAGMALTHRPALYVTTDEEQALQWLDVQPSGRAVLASTDFSLYIPAFTGQRTVSGHPLETPNFAVTDARVRDFYSGAQTAAERRAQLAAWGAAFVVVGPRERALGATLLSAEDGVELAADFGAVMIYEVR